MMSAAERQRTLAWLATQFDGVREQGGNNRGPIVERFQRTIGPAEGEPWCVSFVQYCLAEVDKLTGEPLHRLPHTESSQFLWNAAALELRSDKPENGSIVVWRKSAGLGHAGIVVSVDGDAVHTIEGNTGMDDQRDGDGVALKRREKGQIPGMTLLGYLNPWGKL